MIDFWSSSVVHKDQFDLKIFILQDKNKLRVEADKYQFSMGSADLQNQGNKTDFVIFAPYAFLKYNTNSLNIFNNAQENLCM